MPIYKSIQSAKLTHCGLVFSLPRGANAPSPSPTRAQRHSGPQRWRGSPRLGGGVSGSPSRLSPVMALASILRAPAGDPAYAPPSPLPPVLYRGSPANYLGWSGLGSVSAKFGANPITFEPPITCLKMTGSKPPNLDRFSFSFFFFLSSHIVVCVLLSPLSQQQS